MGWKIYLTTKKKESQEYSAAAGPLKLAVWPCFMASSLPSAYNAAMLDYFKGWESMTYQNELPAAQSLLLPEKE